MQPKSHRASVLDDVGNPDAQPGSRDWARWFVLRAKKRRQDLESDASSLRELLNDLAKFEAWKPLGLASFSMLCSREIDLSMDEVEAILAAKPGQTIRDAVLGKHGGDRKSKKAKDQDDNIILIPGQGTSKAYLLARLNRDNPEIKARLDAGEFASVRAAAIEAGIVSRSFQCPEDPAKAAKRLKLHFQGDRLAALIKELSS